MKKIVTALMTLVLSLALACPVLAADFVESIGYKPAPEIVVLKEEDGKSIIGYIEDEEGNKITIEHKDCLVITPVSEADSSQEIPSEEKEILLKEYNDFATGKQKLSDIEGLDEYAKKILGEGKDADDLVIRDFFDASLICDEKEELKKDGTTIDLTFKVGVGKDTPINAIVFLNGEWQLVKNVVNNGDGTVTCTFEDLCPVAFIVPGETVEQSGSTTPITGDNANIVMWSAIAAVSLVLIIALGVVYRRRITK